MLRLFSSSLQRSLLVPHYAAAASSAAAASASSGRTSLQSLSLTPSLSLITSPPYLSPPRRHFHWSPTLQGRHTGSKAMQLPARAPSKKQQKKRHRLQEAQAESADPRRDKIRERHFARQVGPGGKIGKKLDEMKEILKAGIQSLSLPLDELNELLLGEVKQQSEVKDYQPEKVISLLTEQKLLLANRNLENSIRDTDIPNMPRGVQIPTKPKELVEDILHISPDWANAALKQLITNDSRSKSSSPFKSLSLYNRAMKLYNLMNDCNVPIESSVNVDLIQAATKAQLYMEADAFFEKFLESGQIPTVGLWDAKISNVAASGQIQQAIALIDQLKKLDLHQKSAVMYNAVLKAMIHRRSFEDAKRFWLRMHSDGVPLNLQSFEVMLEGCSFQGEVERAFFLMDELRSGYGLQPTKEVFVQLFKACGRAPHWVNGYQDIIHDAMIKMEGCEIIPDVEIYNSVLEAYALAGDSLSAEYYFWEMKRKGIVPNSQSYIRLVDAYAKNQSIGAANYGWKGKYFRQPEEPLSRDEFAMKEIGAHRTAELLTSGMDSEVKTVKGKRMKAVLSDILDEDYAAKESVMDIIRAEAFGSDAIENDADGESDFEPDDFNFDEEVAKDPSLQRLMADVKAELKGIGSQDNELDSDLLVDGSTEDTKLDLEARMKMMSKTPAMIEVENQLLAVADKLRDYETEQFTDPFTDLKGIKGTKSAVMHSRPQAQMEAQQDRMNEQISLLDALDGSKSTSHAIELSKAVDDRWDIIEFGKLPNLDADHYLARMPLSTRRKINKKRGELALKEVLHSIASSEGDGRENQSMIVNSKDIRTLWNKFLRVHSEAVHVDDAMAVFDMMKSDADLAPDSCTYEYMIRMFIRAKDIDSAVNMKDSMKDLGLVPTSESYGLIVQSFTHRNNIVEALQTLEEASKHNVKIHERNLTVLRNRCKTLGIRHANLGEDPNIWMKDVKIVRRNMKESSRRGIQPLQSAAWH